MNNCGYLIIAASLVIAAFGLPPKNREGGDYCQPFLCRAPDCRCADTESGGDFDVADTPQLVMVTFDDAVTALNYDLIEKSLNQHKNPDGCSAQATFYVSHEYTDYSKVHQLWAEGHEIALHSITHSPYNSYWKNLSVEHYIQEFGDQRKLMAHFADIPAEDINGMRMPLFQLSGDNSYVAMKEAGIKYDSSWPTQKFRNPALWPYTLDYLSSQDCSIGDCPTSSIPGVWVQPIINWADTNGLPCAMVDACHTIPSHDVNQLVEWMKTNFHRHYDVNRAPFGYHLHAAWLQKGENHFAAFIKFLEYLEEFEDVFLVGTNRVIEYAKNPVPLSDFDSCADTHSSTCKANSCLLHKKTDLGTEERYMTVCTSCPPSYPWLGDPLGHGSSKESSESNESD